MISIVKKNKFLISFFIITFLSTHLQLISASIVTINSFSEVDFELITQDDLVIFDVDDTLTQPKDGFSLITTMKKQKHFALLCFKNIQL